MLTGFIKVDDLTAAHALVIYRRMGADLRQLINPPGKPLPVGWAFMPRFSSLLLEAVRKFLRTNDVTMVKMFSNDFDFVDPFTGDSLYCNSEEESVIDRVDVVYPLQ